MICSALVLYLCLYGESALVFSEFGHSEDYRITGIIHVLSQLTMKPCSEVNWEINVIEK